jgi:photosystem II stability/assembly factor-like uncharacterized protein
MRKIISIILLCLSCSIFSQWIQQTSGTTNSLTCISMAGISTETGWAVGVGGVILKTTNGGTNWVSVFSPTNRTLKAVHCINQSTVIAAGYDGIFIKSTNGGGDWTANFIGSFDIYNIQFINSTTGFMGGETGVVWKTTNAGDNWNGIVVNSLDNYGCFFVNSTTGYTCGPLINTQTSSVKRTTNGGSSWQQSVNIFGILKSITFFSDQKGWSCGNLGTIARTTNGGATWGTFAPINSSITLNDIYFSKPEEFGNGTTGWIAADSGKIFISTNSGVNWTVQSTPVSNNLISVQIIGNLYGWAVGENGCILRTTNGGVTIGIHNISNEVPSGYNLSQNYPNPFNPVTNIEFSVPQTANVKLIVYDISGKQVEELVNQKLAAGTYKADFDSKQLASGIYFYRLISEDFSETKRMILVK